MEQLSKFKLQAGEQDRIKIFPPTVNGFRNFFRGYREKECNKIKSICRVQLPVQVETNIPKPKRLRWANKGIKQHRILYIRLKCAKNQYAENRDCESVEA